MDLAAPELYAVGPMAAFLVHVRFNLCFAVSLWSVSYWCCLCWVWLVVWFLCIEILYGRSEISIAVRICSERWSWASRCRVNFRCVPPPVTSLLCTRYITIPTLCFWFFVFCKTRRRRFLYIHPCLSLGLLQIWYHAWWFLFFARTGAVGAWLLQITHV